MLQLEKLDIDDWSEKAMSNFLMKGHTIDHIFPIQFEMYCKIFHPFAIAPTYEAVINEVYNGEDNIAIKYIKSRILKCIDRKEDFIPKPVKLLAKLYNIPFDINFESDKIIKVWDGQPDWLLFPDEGTLDKSILYELSNILIESSINQECYFHYVSYAIETYTETIYKGLIEELPKTIDIGLAGTPSTVWPVSKEWYLYSNYDAAYTLIGGTEKMINKILNNTKFEAFEWDSNSIFYPEK